LFQTATASLAEGLHDPLFVQVHGFDGPTADAIVSEGPSRMTERELAKAGHWIALALGLDEVVLGGDDLKLGGRENAQGRLLAGRARFLHLELSPEVRERLKGDEVARGLFEAALLSLADRTASDPVAVDGP
jgi:hypothetical protein